MSSEAIESFIVHVEDYRLLDKAQVDYKDHDLKKVTWNKIRESKIIRLVPNYTYIFIDLVRGIGSYVKGLPKTKPCKSFSFTVSFRRICKRSIDHRVGMFVKLLLVISSYTFMSYVLSIFEIKSFLPSE